MKKKKKGIKIILFAVCIVAVAVGAVFAVKYIKSPEKPVTTSSGESVTHTQTAAENQTQKVTVTEKSTETGDESGDNAKTILNAPKSQSDYEPTDFEAKLFNAINAKREENSLPALNWNSCLHTKAKIRADEAVSLFSHTRPSGKKPSSVLSDEEISFTLFGECLAKGTKENDEGVGLLINGFMKEPLQADMILSKDYSYAAAAVSTDENGAVCAVILFCQP